MQALCCLNCSKLEDKITYLEYELNVLKESVGLNPSLVETCSDRYKLTRQQARFLVLLYKANTRTCTHLYMYENTATTHPRKDVALLVRDTYYGLVKVHITHIRDRMKLVLPRSMCCIETVWGQGYRITKEAHDYIKADLEQLKGEG